MSLLFDGSQTQMLTTSAKHTITASTPPKLLPLAPFPTESSRVRPAHFAGNLPPIHRFSASFRLILGNQLIESLPLPQREQAGPFLGSPRNAPGLWALVALGGKRRWVCPGCGVRQRVESAALLVDIRSFSVAPLSNKLAMERIATQASQGVRMG